MKQRLLPEYSLLVVQDQLRCFIISFLDASADIISLLKLMRKQQTELTGMGMGGGSPLA